MEQKLQSAGAVMYGFLAFMSWEFRLQTFPALSTRTMNVCAKDDMHWKWLCRRLQKRALSMCRSGCPRCQGFHGSRSFAPSFPFGTCFQVVHRRSSSEVQLRNAAHGRFEAALLDDLADPEDVPPTTERFSITFVSLSSRWHETKTEVAGNVRKKSFLSPASKAAVDQGEGERRAEGGNEDLMDSGQWFDSSWKKGKENEGENEGFSGDTVEARVRSVDVAQGRVVMCAPAIGLRPFSFDAVLPGTASQSSAYRRDEHACGGLFEWLQCRGDLLRANGERKTHTCFGRDAMSRGLVPRM